MTHPLVPTALVIAILSLTSQAAEPSLAPLMPNHSALLGFFGTPGPGSYVRGGPVWHRSGQIFALESHSSGLHPLRIWKADSKTVRPSLAVTLNVGEAWCVSQKGDLLCAQSYLGVDSTASDPVPSWRVYDPGAFGCFPLQGGPRLWQLAIRPNESISSAAFSLDDKFVTVLSIWSNQMSLRLLDATNGTLVRQYDFPGRQPERSFRDPDLIVRADEVWMQHKEDDRTILLRFPLATLQPSKFNCPPLESHSGSVKISSDGNHILSLSGDWVACFGLNKDKWAPIFESDHTFSSLNPEYGDETFYNAEFTPDGKSLVVFTSTSVCITDLASGKTHRIKLNLSSGGTLSPDGSQLLIQYEHGFEIISLRETDVTNPSRHRQNVWQPHHLRFGKEDKTLYAADAGGIWVWDVPTRKPRAWLKSLEEHSPIHGVFQTLSIIDDETQVVSEEDDNFLLWKLPSLSDPPPATPQIVPPTLAFGGIRLGDSGAYPGVYIHPDLKWIVSCRGNREIVIRQSLGAGSSRSVSGPSSSITPGLTFFDDADGFTFYDAFTSKWQNIELVEGRLTELKSSRDSPVAVLPRGRSTVCEFKGRIWGSNLGGTMPLPDFDVPTSEFSVQRHLKAAVSADEKRCAWILASRSQRHHHVFVWEIETGKLLGHAPLPTNDGKSVALSADGSLLACGHENTAISLWEVAKLSPYIPPVTTPLSPAPKSPIVRPSGLPPRSPNTRQDYMYGGGIWEFRENGSVSKGDALPESGTLRVGGVDFATKGRRLTSSPDLFRFFQVPRDSQDPTRRKPNDPKYRPIPTRQVPDLYAGLIHIAEGALGEVWASRQIGYPAGSSGRFLTFTDKLTHLGNDDVQTIVEFETRFPALTKTLIDSTFSPVEIESDGALKVAPDAVWIAGLPDKGSARTVPILVFRSPSGGHSSRLIWKPETHTLTVRHPITLKPGETRFLMHGLRVVTLEDGESPAQFTPPPSPDFGQIVAFSVMQRGINFGQPEGLDHLAFLNFKNAQVTSDEFGAIWQCSTDGSLANESNVSSAYQLWIDGTPLPFSSPSIFVYRSISPSHSETPARLYTLLGSSLDAKLSITRSVPRPDVLPLITDRFTNPTEDPQTTKLTYVSTITEPIKALYNARGEPVEPNQSPKPASSVGGAFIVEFDGPTRPSTAFVFYQEGAKAEPKISWPSPKMCQIEYEITIPPGKSIELMHGATQRPLASFGSVSEAFTGVLPFGGTTKQHSADVMNLK